MKNPNPLFTCHNDLCGKLHEEAMFDDPGAACEFGSKGGNIRDAVGEVAVENVVAAVGNVRGSTVGDAEGWCRANNCFDVGGNSRRTEGDYLDR